MRAPRRHRMRFHRKDFIADVKNYWAELDESQRAARQWALAALALAVLAVPAWYFGRPFWQRWQRERALEQVRVFAQRNDYRNATLALRRAAELSPNDPTTWQEAVRVLGDIGSPDVLQAREQLARLAPEDVGLKLALAGEALRFERVELAEQTLQAIAREERRDAAFYRLAAALALALGRSDELEENLAKLAAALPGDAQARFGLAAVRLWSGDEAKQAAGRAEIEALTAEPKVRIRAALELLKDANRQHDERRTTTAMTLLLRRFAPELPKDFPSASLAAWTMLVERLKAAAASDGPGEAAALARWLADLGQAREALVWLESLPAPAGADGAVKEMLAQLSAEIGDLDRTEKYLREGAWGGWPRDVLTLAMASRLQRLRYNEAHARATWEDAVASAGDSAAGLRALVRLAEAWREPDAMEAALQAAAERGAGGGAWALEALETIYRGRRDLAKLWSLYDGWIKLRPQDERLAAKWIVVGCLLNRGGAALAARAETLEAEGEQRVSARLALAAARWRQGRPRETVKLIEELPPEVREKPGAAFWVALAQADLGNKALTGTALAVAVRGGISAEELGLLRAAAAKVKLRLPET